jgi:hypothetical protein
VLDTIAWQDRTSGLLAVQDHQAVRTVVVGASNPQMGQTIGRMNQPVPEALWEELRRRSLLPA